MFSTEITKIDTGEISECYLKKQDINSWLVKNGYAIAYRRYSKKYINDEQYAEDNKLGVWKMNFYET